MRDLPERARDAIDTLVRTIGTRALGETASRISARYRAAGDGRSLALRSPDEVAAYVVARMPATYAVVDRVLGEIWPRLPGTPASLLDLGAGPGTAALAAERRGPLSRITLVEVQTDMADMARTILPHAELVVSDMQAGLAASDRSDLVLASYALGEIPRSALSRLSEAMLDRAILAAVVIEPGTPRGHDTVMRARDAMVAAGGRVIAPCPHSQPCPLSEADWCHFAVRLARSRAHLRAKDAEVPFEDEPYSYVAVVPPGVVGVATASRLIRRPRVSKVGATLALCTASGLETRNVPARDREAYRQARKRDWGDEYA